MNVRVMAMSVAVLALLPLEVRAQDVDGGVPPGAGPSAPAAPAPAAPAPAVSAPPAPKKPPVEFHAAWGKGVGLTVLDDFEFNLGGRVQLRFLALVPNENSASTRVNQFSLRRARISTRVSWKKELSLAMQLGFSAEDLESDLPSPVRDAYLTWSRWRDLNVRVGQFKVPFDRQYLTSSSKVEFVDRTVGTGEFNLERDVGINLGSDDLFGLGLFQYALFMFGGEGRNRLALNAGLLFGGRVSVTPLGTFKDAFVEADLVRHQKPKLMLGFAYARNNSTGREKSTGGKFFKNGTVSYDHLAADLLFKWQGIAVEGGWLWRRGNKAFLEASDGSRELTRSGFAWYAQASYAPLKWMSFGARFGEVYPMAMPTGVHRSRELGGYLAGYLIGHDLKVQADYFYLAKEDFAVGDHQVRVQIDAQF